MLDVHLTAELRIHARANSHGSDAATVDVPAANTDSMEQRFNVTNGTSRRYYARNTRLVRKVMRRVATWPWRNRLRLERILIILCRTSFE